jgi:hypothetical protein
VITELIIATLFDRVLKLRQFQASEGFYQCCGTRTGAGTGGTV